MILGLDHVSINGKNKKEFQKFIFCYDKMYCLRSFNHKEKNLFISRQFKNHYISLHNTKKNLPPIEKTYYGKTKYKAKNIKISKNQIYLSVISKKKEFKFWKKIFNLSTIQDKINFLSLYDQKQYKFYFKENFKKKDFLDYYGYTSISFVTTDILKIFKSCQNFDIEISKIFNFKLKKKKIKILFFRSPGGIIFEIVQYLL
jgi:hypothetical protein